MAEPTTPTAGSAAERRASWSRGLGLLGIATAVLSFLKIQLFGSSGYTLMWGIVGILGLVALGVGATARSDGRYSGRAKLGIALGALLVGLFALIAGEVIHISG